MLRNPFLILDNMIAHQGQCQGFPLSARDYRYKKQLIIFVVTIESFAFYTFRVGFIHFELRYKRF